MNQPYWIKQENIKNYPSLQTDIQVDTLIIGGGMCGLLSAYYLSKTNRQIALVEAETIGSGASGRSTGKLSAQQGYLYHDLIRIHGESIANDYYQANIEAITSIESIIDELQIDCSFQRRDSLLLALEENELSYLQKEQEAYETLHIPYEVLEASPFDIPFLKGLRMMKQASFHPFQFMQGLANCLSKQLAIYENTPIRQIEIEQNGYRIHSEHHTIHAKSIIMATHFPITDLGNFYFTKVAYVQGMLLCAPLTQPVHDAMMINMNPNHIFSMRSLIDGTQNLAIISGNEHAVGFQNQQDYEKWKQLRKAQLSLKEPIISWQNQDYVSHDRLPLIGNLIKNESGIQFATGFGKWGNTMSVVAAKTMVANLLLETTPYASLFDPHRKQFFFESDYFSGNFTIAKHYLLSYLKSFFAQDKAPNVYTFHENGTVYGAVQKDNKTHIVNIRCPHMGCILNYNEVEETWDCPCHGSRFHYDGSILKGPADHKLNSLEEDPNPINPHIIK